MRNQYNKELSKLNEELLNFGAMAEKIVGMAIESLINQNTNLALETIAFEDEMDKKAEELENQCLDILALQQPMAKDLRIVASVIKMIADIERIGDLSENIAEATIKIGTEEFIKPLIDIPKMADIARDMIKRALECYVKEDVSLAYKVATMDDIVDNIFKDVSTEIFYLINKEIKKIESRKEKLAILDLSGFTPVVAGAVMEYKGLSGAGYIALLPWIFKILKVTTNNSSIFNSRFFGNLESLTLNAPRNTILVQKIRKDIPK